MRFLLSQNKDFWTPPTQQKLHKQEDNNFSYFVQVYFQG